MRDNWLATSNIRTSFVSLQALCKPGISPLTRSTR